MKNIPRVFALLLLFTFVIGVSTAEAQRSKKKKNSTEEYFDESGGFAHRLWYGGGFNLNLGGNGGFGGSQFVVGVSPMVGFKINDILSIGPRFSFDYFESFQNGPNPRVALWGIGPFARAKFSETIFAHVEYLVQGSSNLNEAADLRFNDDGTVDSFFLGLGYQSSGGGLIGYEIMALYNFIDQDEFNIPISFRAGINFNF